jgi:hypothetical protein
MPYHNTGLQPGSKERFSLSSYGMDKLFVFLKATTPYQTYECRYWGPYEPFSYCYYPPNLPLNSDDCSPGYKSFRILVAPDQPDHGKTIIDDHAVYSMPLIVPPIRNKQYARYGKIFSDLWEAASNALLSCNELYIIGYSFPTTDQASKDMFQNALALNKKLMKIVIWNPFPDDIYHLLVEEMKIPPSIIEVRRDKFAAPENRKGLLL